MNVSLAKSTLSYNSGCIYKHIDFGIVQSAKQPQHEQVLLTTYYEDVLCSTHPFSIGHSLPSWLIEHLISLTQDHTNMFYYETNLVCCIKLHCGCIKLTHVCMYDCVQRP